MILKIFYTTRHFKIKEEKKLFRKKIDLRHVIYFYIS